MFYASEETVFKDNPDAWLYKREPEFYQSEEFLMFYHKVLPCPHVMPHNWQECPWTHRGERAARRDLRKCQYSSQLCSKIQRGLECPNGSSCDKAHNIFESWLHPEQFRTQRCGAGVTCLRKVCFFAHSQAELRKPAKIVWPESVTATAAAAGQTEQGSATPEQTEEGNNAGSTAAGDAAGSSSSNSSPVAGTAGVMRNTGSSARSLAQQQQQQDDVDDCAACSACAACPAAPIPLAVGSAAAAGGGKDTLVLALGQLTMTPAIATESSATPMAAAAAAAYSGGSDSACTAAGGCSKAGKITSTDPIMMNDQSQSGKISLGSMARQHRHAAASVAARDAGTQQHPRLNLQQAMQLHQQQQAQLQQRQQLQNQQQQQLQLQQQQQQRQLQQQQMLQIQAQLHILQQQQQLMSPSAFAPSTGTSLDQAPGPMGSSPHMPMSPAAAAAAPVSLLPLTGFGSLGSESLSGLQGLPLQHLSPSPSLDQQHELLLLLQQYEQQQQRVAQHQLNQAAAGAVLGSGLMSPMTTLPTLGLHPSLATANALPSAAAAAAAAFSPAAAAAFSHNSMELPTLSSNSFGALTGLSQLSGLSSGDAAAFMQQQQPPSRHIPRGW